MGFNINTSFSKVVAEKFFENKGICAKNLPFDSKTTSFLNAKVSLLKISFSFSKLISLCIVYSKYFRTLPCNSKFIPLLFI